MFCKLLKDELGDVFEFEIPKGVMAVWTTLNTKQSWACFSEVAISYNLEIVDGKPYDNANLGHNFICIGFAAHNDDNEIYELVDWLKKTVGDVI